MNPETTPDEPKLYVGYLGGDPTPGRLSEDHEAVVVVAHDAVSARSGARAKWAGQSRAHVDALEYLGVIDGYRVRLEAADDAEALGVDVTYDPSDDWGSSLVEDAPDHQGRLVVRHGGREKESLAE
jgi:hypothetical protein